MTAAQMPHSPAVVNAERLSRPGAGERYQGAETATGATQGAGDTKWS